MTPLPGDFAVVRFSGPARRCISLGEWLNGDAFTQYDHALLCSGPEA